MILKISQQCGMRCTHCVEDSRPGTGQHMTLDTFKAALDCTRRVETLARSLYGYDLLLFSGGEATENPGILEMLDLAAGAEFMPLLITNGMWLNDPYLAGHILRPDRKIFVQVTNDARFYPEAPPRVTRDPRLTNIDQITIMHRLGRATRLKDWQGVPERQAPSSFNIRSLVRSLGDIREALAEIRGRALTGFSGHCAPSVDHEGNFVAGESRFCTKVGTVESSCEDLTRGILEMGECDRCGLESKLDDRHREAIGLGRKSA